MSWRSVRFTALRIINGSLALIKVRSTIVTIIRNPSSFSLPKALFIGFYHRPRFMYAFLREIHLVYPKINLQRTFPLTRPRDEPSLNYFTQFHRSYVLSHKRLFIFISIQSSRYSMEILIKKYTKQDKKPELYYNKFHDYSRPK